VGESRLSSCLRKINSTATTKRKPDKTKKCPGEKVIDCVVKKQSITMRRAARERKPQPDSAKPRRQHPRRGNLQMTDGSTTLPHYKPPQFSVQKNRMFFCESGGYRNQSKRQRVSEYTSAISGKTLNL
jgi:hypothetical protein